MSLTAAGSAAYLNLLVLQCFSSLNAVIQTQMNELIQQLLFWMTREWMLMLTCYRDFNITLFWTTKPEACSFMPVGHILILVGVRSTLSNFWPQFLEGQLTPPYLSFPHPSRSLL